MLMHCYKVQKNLLSSQIKLKISRYGICFYKKTISCRSQPLELYDPNGPRFMDSFVLGHLMKESSKLGLQMAIENSEVKV